MLPHNNNYYAYQGLPASNNLTFDLKVNVDFNNGRVNLGVPPQLHNFAKTPQIPVMYAEPTYVAPVSNIYSAPSIPVQRSQPVIHQIKPVWQPVPQYARNQPSYLSAYNPQPIEQSYYMRYSQNQKLRSHNDTYQDTSFSMGIEKSVDAVICVICDKPINRDQFHQHIEEHKRRRLEYGRKEEKAAPEAVNSFSVRNQNSLENVAEIYRQPPSNSFQNPRILQVSDSRLQSSRNASRSRYIQDTQSRIVYAPAHTLSSLNASNPSDFVYNNSFGSNKSNQIGKQFVQNSRTVKPVSTSHGNSLEQNQSRYYQGNQNNRVSKVSSMNSLTSGMAKREESRRLSQNKQPSQNYYQQNSRNSSLVRNTRYQKTSNNYLDHSQSRVLRVNQKQKQPSFEDIQQSVIHRINDISRDYSILQLKKQLNIEQIEEESSSDDQAVFMSVRPSPPSNFYQSVIKSKHSIGMTSSSNMTQKLNRTKMPKNYLARQEFIVNTMLSRSCYKSRHTNWK